MAGIVTSLAALTLAALTITGAVLSMPVAAAGDGPQVDFRLTITNQTQPDVPMREGAFLLHRDAHRFWQPGGSANEATERIAEVGTGIFAVILLDAQELSANTERNGRTAGWDVRAAPGDLLSFVQMLAPTNDALIGVDSLPLFQDGQPLAASFDLIVWDAGTEQNSPVGSGFAGGQPDMIHLDENLDNGVATFGVIHPHEQFPGLQAQLTVTPLREWITLDRGLHALGWTGVTTSSAAFLAANPRVSALFWWNSASEQWLVDSPRLPDALRPAITLARGAAAFLRIESPGAIVVPLAPATLAAAHATAP